MNKCTHCGKDFSHDGLPGPTRPDICFNCHTPERRVMARTGCDAYVAARYCQLPDSISPPERLRIAMGIPLDSPWQVTVT